MDIDIHIIMSVEMCITLKCWVRSSYILMTALIVFDCLNSIFQLSSNIRLSGWFSRCICHQNLFWYKHIFLYIYIYISLIVMNVKLLGQCECDTCIYSRETTRDVMILEYYLLDIYKNTSYGWTYMYIYFWNCLAL